MMSRVPPPKVRRNYKVRCFQMSSQTTERPAAAPLPSARNRHTAITTIEIDMVGFDARRRIAWPACPSPRAI